MDGNRNWAALIPEALILIFSRLDVDSLVAVSLVCQTWLHTVQHPECWDSIHLNLHKSFLNTFIKETIPIEDHDSLHKQACSIVTRSRARAKSVCISYASNRTVTEVAIRCPSIESLSLKCCTRVSERTLLNLIQSCKHLRYLEASFCKTLSTTVITTIGHRCPNLVGLNLSCSPLTDEIAVAIGKSIPKLKWVNLRGTTISNAGLSTILQSCQELEYVNVLHCHRLKVNQELLMKLYKAKEYEYDIPVEEVVARHCGYSLDYP